MNSSPIHNSPIVQRPSVQLNEYFCNIQTLAIRTFALLSIAFVVSVSLVFFAHVTVPLAIGVGIGLGVVAVALQASLVCYRAFNGPVLPDEDDRGSNNNALVLPDEDDRGFNLANILAKSPHHSPVRSPVAVSNQLIQFPMPPLVEEESEFSDSPHHSPVRSPVAVPDNNQQLKERAPVQYRAENWMGLRQAQFFRGSGFRIDFFTGNGTPGVNRRGQWRADQEYVEQRAGRFRRELAPFGHTRETYVDYQALAGNLTVFATGLRTAPGKTEDITVETLIQLHDANKEIQKRRFGKQLHVAVTGGGPIGIAASIIFYKYGFRVLGLEKRSVENPDYYYADREQPFSLMRQSYWLLASLGIQLKGWLEAYGYNIEEEINRKSYEIPAAVEFQAVGRALLSEANRAVLGAHAAEYIPNSMSLPVKTVQELLAQSITHTQVAAKRMGSDVTDLVWTFDAEVTGCQLMRDGRRALLIGGEQVTPDVIYNASGGRLNETLGFNNIPVATYHGMGAFFKRPEMPMNRAAPQQLSRAVRIFSSFNKGDPIYANMELSEEEFNHPDLRAPLVAAAMQDIGVTEKIRDFTVRIDLQHVERAATVTEYSNGIPQLIFCGGDSLLKPHFITASGANFGFFGLIELSRELDAWIVNATESHQHIVGEYNHMASLLQRQSAQVILELFGADLV